MSRAQLFFGMVLVGMAAAAGPLKVSAGGESLASPTPRPTERITAPEISGKNPEVVLSEGEQGDITPSDIFAWDGGQLPGYSLPQVDLAPQAADLPLSWRAPGPDAVNCGPAALAEAMRVLNDPAGSTSPTAAALEGWLRERGLMYAWGTGVQELAFAARQFGYPGSSPFQGWTLAQLKGALEEGRPVVVALGVNGANRPGHFLTVTGFSPDGKEISALDPVRGSVHYSLEEFSALWELQGRSGLTLPADPAPAVADPALPWMGLLSAVSALALSLGRKEDPRQRKLLDGFRRWLSDPARKGIGAGYLADAPVQESGERSWAQPPPGMKAVALEIPVYETRQVKVGLRGIKVQVPVYETKRVLAGCRKDIRQVPVYGLRKVISGERWVEKRIPVTRYRMEKVWVWKQVAERVPVVRWIGGKKLVVGYRDQTRRKRVQVTKKVPYKTTKKLLVKEPVYSWKRVQTGTRREVRWVPTYKEKQVLVEYKTVHHTVPVFEERRVQVGTRTVTRQVYEGEDPTYLPAAAEGEPGDGQTGGQGPAQDLRLVEKLIPDMPGSREVDSALSRELEQFTQRGIPPAGQASALDLAARAYELTEPIYLTGGPGVRSYGEKAEDGWSKHSYGGSSLPGMKILGLLSLLLVWLRDNTGVIKAFGGKPDAQAMFLYSHNRTTKVVDEIIVFNKGYGTLQVNSIYIRRIDSNTGKTDTNELFPNYSSDNENSIETLINPGSYQSIIISPSQEINADSDCIFYIKLSSEFDRFGYLIHALSIDHE